MAKLSKFLLVIIVAIILLALILIFQPSESVGIDESLPMNKTSFGYGCISLPNLLLSNSNGDNVIVNQETGNECHVILKKSNFTNARGPENKQINVDFIATDVEPNCDGQINSYDSFVISKDHIVYQCLQDAPI